MNGLSLLVAVGAVLFLGTLVVIVLSYTSPETLPDMLTRTGRGVSQTYTWMAGGAALGLAIGWAIKRLR
ncbi:hypothetical protein [Gymnodinialimonas hymeniacidonis]|uniref:hypothetical protein n=1 Tax=Gymnodinialimonas hymeniacidonis TaxID=3126508 RepID=UPI0034C5C0DB